MAPSDAAERASDAPSGPASPGLLLYVRLPDERILPVELDADSTVGAVALAAKAQGAVRGPVRLFVHGEQLDPAVALADSGIGAEAELECQWGLHCGLFDRAVAEHCRQGAWTSTVQDLFLPYSAENNAKIIACLRALKEVVHTVPCTDVTAAIVPILLGHLQPDVPKEVKLDAFRALSGFSTSCPEWTDEVTSAPDVIACLCGLLDAPVEIAEQAMCCLYELTRRWAFCCRFLQEGAPTSLIALTENIDLMSPLFVFHLLGTIEHCMSIEFSRNLNLPTVQQLVELSTRLMPHTNDAAASTGLYTLCRLVYDPDARSSITQHPELLSLVVRRVALAQRSTPDNNSAVWVIKRLCSDEVTAQLCIDCGAVPALESLLTKQIMLRDCLDALHNITGVAPAQCATVADHPGLLAVVSSTINMCCDQLRHGEAALGLEVLGNVVRNGRAEHRELVFDCGGVASIIRALEPETTAPLENASHGRRVMESCRVIHFLCGGGGQEAIVKLQSAGAESALRRAAAFARPARQVLDAHFHGEDPPAPGPPLGLRARAASADLAVLVAALAALVALARA